MTRPVSGAPSVIAALLEGIGQRQQAVAQVVRHGIEGEARPRVGRRRAGELLVGFNGYQDIAGACSGG